MPFGLRRLFVAIPQGNQRDGPEMAWSVCNGADESWLSSPFGFPGGRQCLHVHGRRGPRALTPVNVQRALWFQTLKGLRDSRSRDDEQ